MRARESRSSVALDRRSIRGMASLRDVSARIAGWRCWFLVRDGRGANAVPEVRLGESASRGRSGSSEADSRPARPWTSAKTAGSTSSVASVAATSPPMTARPSGAVCSPPSPSPGPSGPCRRSWRSSSSGSAAAGPARPSTAAAAALGASSRRCRSAKVTSRIALATATPIAMIAPMNDWMLSVVPVSQQGDDHAGDDRRRRRDDDQRQPDRLEVGRQQQQDDDDRPAPRPTASPRSISCIGAIWPRTSTVAPLGGVAGPRRSPRSTLAGDPAQVLAGDVGRQADRRAACCSGRTRRASSRGATLATSRSRSGVAAGTLDRGSSRPRLTEFMTG